MFRNHIQFDSFDNFNKSRNSGISSASRSSVLNKDGKISKMDSQEKPKSRLNSLSIHSLKMSKAHYYSRESHEQIYRRRNFTERRFTFLSQSKNINSKNSQIHIPPQASHQRVLLNNRKTEERRSFLINRGRSIEKMTDNDFTFRTNRIANSVDRNEDLLSWNLIPESFKGLDFETYIPVRKLGAGAHGSAYEVLHKSGQNIVTKFFGKEQKRFFRHEAAVLAQLKKISELLANNTFEFDIEPYFEIDSYYGLNLVAGMGTLDDFIYFLNKKDLALNQQELLFIFEKLFESYLNLAKLNYAHRDIKPGNIILDPKDLTPKFIDYSLAACYGGTNLITTIAGTLPYISPFLEKPLNKEKLISADLYSLGVTLLQVALPKINILACNHIAKMKLVDSKFKAMPMLKKILKTLLWDSNKKLSILRKILKQKDVFKNEDLENELKRVDGEEEEEAIDKFELPKDKNSCLAEKYLQDFIKFLKPNQEDTKDNDNPLKKNNELSFPEEEEERDHPLSLAREAVKLFHSDSDEVSASLLFNKIKACILGLDKDKTENREYQLILLNNLEFLSEKYKIDGKNDQVFQNEVLFDHSEAIESLLFQRNRRDKKSATASEFIYQDELITNHPQILATTNNFNLIILKNSCLKEFEKILKVLSPQQIFINKLKDFVFNNSEFSGLLLSTMVNLEGHLHLLLTFLDFINIFVNAPFPEIQGFIDEANIIKKNSSSLYDKFIENDFRIGMQEIKNYQLFYLMIGAVLYYHDQIPKTEKSQYDIEQKVQSFSKDLNKEIFLSFQPPTEQDHQFPKIQNLVDLCWKDEETREVIYRYFYKYNPESPKPNLTGLHLYKRANFRLKDLSVWIDREPEKLLQIPDIYFELEAYIEKDKKTIEFLQKSLSLLTNLRKVKLHLVQPFQASDKAKNRIEKEKYDDLLAQTLEIISLLKSLPQLEIVFDFIYISPSHLELLGGEICKLKQLKKIEIEFSYCPHITDEAVKQVLENICCSLEVDLVFKLFACQKVIYLDSKEDILRIAEIKKNSKTKEIDFVCKPYSEHHSRAEIAGIVSQGFPLFL